MTIRKLPGNQLLWSAFAALVFLIFMWSQAYLHSISDFDTSAVLLSMKSSLLAPTLFWWQVARYFFTVFALYFIFLYLIAELVRIDQSGLRRALKTPVYWVAALVFLQVIDSGWFPFAGHVLTLAFGKTIPIVCIAVLAIMLLMGAAHLCRRLYKRWGRVFVASALCIIATTVGVTAWRALAFGPQYPLPSDKPNVILIGIDGLRPSELAYMHTYDKSYQSPMPFLDSELEKSLVFTQAYTNVARTYPSWMAMLTGQGPLQTGIRLNLQNDTGWWQGKTLTLPQYFKKQGYQTAWGIDDVGFANIGLRQGYDTVLSPTPGAVDFIIPEIFSDLAIVNIFSNWWPGRYLLPVVYSNRRRGFAYYPATFSHWLSDYIHSSNRNKPLFMAVHFELAHYPNVWADGKKFGTVFKAMNDKNVDKIELSHALYRYNLQRIDQQISDLMKALKNDGRLKNSILVFLSDHGNGLKTGTMSKNRFGETVYVGDTSYGHGTDISNLNQNHALLAIQGRGQTHITPGYRDALASLPSLAPTLLQLVNIPHKQNMLPPLPLKSINGTQSHNVVFFESGLTLPGLKSGKINLTANLAKKAKLYHILSDGRLVIRNSEIPNILTKKQRGAFDGKWLIVDSWNKEKENFEMKIFNRTSGALDEDINEINEDIQIKSLFNQFCQHYSRSDIYFSPPPTCSKIQRD